MSKSNAPGLATGKRSAAFQRYLDEQTPERRAEILAAESKYLVETQPAAADDQKSSARGALEQDFRESFQGYEDRPAGGFDID